LKTWWSHLNQWPVGIKSWVASHIAVQLSVRLFGVVIIAGVSVLVLLYLVLSSWNDGQMNHELMLATRSFGPYYKLAESSMRSAARYTVLSDIPALVEAGRVNEASASVNSLMVGGEIESVYVISPFASYSRGLSITQRDALFSRVASMATEADEGDLLFDDDGAFWLIGFAQTPLEDGLQRRVVVGRLVGKNSPWLSDFGYMTAMSVRVQTGQALAVADPQGESDPLPNVFGPVDPSGEVHYASFMLQSGPKVGAQQTYRSEASGDLFVLTVYRPVNQVTRAFWPLLLGMTLLFAVLVGGISFTTHREVVAVLQPLFALERAAKEMATGNYDVSVATSRKDEVGRLAAVFDEMRRDARQRRESLEVAVQQRTLELEQMSRQRAQLAASMVTRLEEQRITLATELHDAVGNPLAAIRTQILGRIEKEPDEDLQTKAETMGQVLKIIRHWVTTLRPLPLDQEGVFATIKAYAEANLLCAGIDLKMVRGISDETVPEQVGIVLLRAAQVAITNVVEHAQAKSVRISLTNSKTCPGWVDMSIDDDGVGFDVKKVEQLHRGHRYNGLVNMRERVQWAHGTVKVWSICRAGTFVTVSLPLEQPKDLVRV
jgi:two-component system, NarL family, sensor kinase